MRSNLRLVVNIAKRFADRGMSLGDLIEEGNLGLIKAVDYYDPDRGTRFSTYAAWWIKQSIKAGTAGERSAGTHSHLYGCVDKSVAPYRRRTGNQTWQNTGA